MIMIYSAIIPLIFWPADPITRASFNNGRGSKGLDVAKAPPKHFEKVLPYNVIILTAPWEKQISPFN